MATQKFRIRGLRHEDEQSLARAIQGLEGVYYAALSHQDECAEVDFEDDRVTTAEICAVIAARGYEAILAG